MKGPLIDMGGSFLFKLNILTMDGIYTIMVKSS